MPTRGPTLRRERNSLAVWVLRKHKNVPEAGAAERVPGWVELNRFPTWLREPGILAGGKKVKGHRGLGALGWGRGGIPGNPGGAQMKVNGQRQQIWRCSHCAHGPPDAAAPGSRY